MLGEHKKSICIMGWRLFEKNPLVGLLHRKTHRKCGLLLLWINNNNNNNNYYYYYYYCFTREISSSNFLFEFPASMTHRLTNQNPQSIQFVSHKNTDNYYYYAFVLIFMFIKWKISTVSFTLQTLQSQSIN